MAMTVLSSSEIPRLQTAAVKAKPGEKAVLDGEYPVPQPKQNEVLAKILYTGVCASDLHAGDGVVVGPNGSPINPTKFPHVGGHEGVGRIIAIGPGCSDHIQLGKYVGIRYASRICRRCEPCMAGTEQYCTNSTNHINHEDGSFEEYIALDADYLCLLPDDIDPAATAPVLCAGLTTYKAVLTTDIKPGQWLVVMGAAGGLGHFAVQYAAAFGARVCGVDAGDKGDFVRSLGAEVYIDFTAADDLAAQVTKITGGGAHAVIVTASSVDAYTAAAQMLRTHGTLSCVGVPPGKAALPIPVVSIIIKSLRIVGNLVGNLKECLEAVDFVRRGEVKPHISIRDFADLPQVFEEMEAGKVIGRVVLKVARD